MCVAENFNQNENNTEITNSGVYTFDPFVFIDSAL